MFHNLIVICCVVTLERFELSTLSLKVICATTVPRGLCVDYTGLEPIVFRL